MVAVLFSTIVRPGAFTRADELAQMLARHEEALRAIRTVHLEMDVITWIDGEAWTTETVEWWLDGTRERQSKRIIASPEDIQPKEEPPKSQKLFMSVDGRRVYFSQRRNEMMHTLRYGLKPGDVLEQHEVALGEHEIRRLAIAGGTDGAFALKLPLSPGDLDSIDFYRVGAYLAKREDQKLHSDVAVRLLLALAPSYNLLEAVRDSQSATTTVDSEGRVRVHLRFGRQLPELFGAREVVCTLEPAAGYLIQKAEFSPGGGREVKEFVEPLPGVFFPKLVAGRGKREGKDIKIDFHVKNVEINQPIPAEQFSVSFPEGALVQDLRASTLRFYVWGPNDKPVRTFPTVEEFEAWRDKESMLELEKMGLVVKRASPRTPPRNWLLLVGNLLLVALLAGLFVVRRRLLRHSSQAAPDDSRTGAKPS
jgi:outer membrane lipoprotein-sorting protein